MTMQRWEYLTETLISAETVFQFGRRPGEAPQVLLSELGEGGWELVSATPLPGVESTTLLVFKRPKADEPNAGGTW